MNQTTPIPSRCYRAGGVVVIDNRNERGEGRIVVRSTSDDCGRDVELFAHRRYGQGEIEYRVNWGTFGSQGYRFAAEYASLINVAASLALDLPRQDGALEATSCNVFANQLHEITARHAARLSGVRS